MEYINETNKVLPAHKVPEKDLKSYYKVTIPKR